MAAHLELAPPVRVNALSPSLSRTPLAGPIIGSETMAEAITDLHDQFGNLFAALNVEGFQGCCIASVDPIAIGKGDMGH